VEVKPTPPVKPETAPEADPWKTQPAPPVKSETEARLQPPVEPAPPIVPPVEPPAVKLPEPSPTQISATENVSTAPAVEPPSAASIRPAGSLPAHVPGATEEWWEETRPADVAPTQKAAAPAGEDWWATPETAPTHPASRRAIKLKATAETPAKETTDVQPPATTEGWWTSPPEPAPPAESPEKQKTKTKIH